MNQEDKDNLSTHRVIRTLFLATILAVVTFVAGTICIGSKIAEAQTVTLTASVEMNSTNMQSVEWREGGLVTSVTVI